MKTYPPISFSTRRGIPVYIFDKIDGSNIRVEWSRSRAWHKFGRRNGLLDDTNPILKEAPALFFKQYAEDLSRICVRERWDRVVAFFEFAGPGSFAGNHADEPHTLTLIDVSVHPKGLLEPRQFLRLFDDLPGGHARLLHHGNWTQDIERAVEEGALPGMTFEGVVAKGPYVSPGMPLMFKHKSRAWLDRLGAYCGDNLTLFNKMR